MDVKDLLIHHEGLELKPYGDSRGLLTIGVGRCLISKGISHDEALMLLDNDVKDVVKQAEDSFPWFIHLNDARQAVIISMIFNLGLSGFLEFKNAIKAIAMGDFDTAASEILLSKWATQVKSRSADLAFILRSGQWINL